jgi:hypothetical protein
MSNGTEFSKFWQTLCPNTSQANLVIRITIRQYTFSVFSLRAGMAKNLPWKRISWKGTNLYPYRPRVLGPVTCTPTQKTKKKWIQIYWNARHQDISLCPGLCQSAVWSQGEKTAADGHCVSTSLLCKVAKCSAGNSGISVHNLQRNVPLVTTVVTT